MNYVKLWGNKIRAKDVVNANGKSIELKSIQISGNSGSGATLKLDWNLQVRKLFLSIAHIQLFHGSLMASTMLYSYNICI